jgi:O-antigen ligase
VNAIAGDRTVDRWLAALLLLGAWACYLPLGTKYITIVPAALCAALVLWRHRHVQRLQAAPGLWASVALLGALALSAAWSPAPWPLIGSHLGQYGLLLLVPLIGTACPPAVARRALRHFMLASAIVGLLFVLAAADLLPAAPLWRTTIDAEGNQRIATSILLALAATLALQTGLQAAAAPRAFWLLAAVSCAAGLALQDRRSGMLLLPLLLVAWTLVRQPGAWRRLGLLVAIVLAALAASQFADGVRGRLAEGVAELRQYKADDHVATSWGQRLRMWQLTGAMVQERPLAGHGVASWRGLWQERVTPGTALAAHSTPHNEYLLLAQQAGGIGAALWLWLLAEGLRQAAIRGAAGLPSLLVWTTIAWTGLFNAVLRDTKFSLPLILLAALALAASRPDDNRIGRQTP